MRIPYVRNVFERVDTLKPDVQIHISEITLAVVDPEVIPLIEIREYNTSGEIYGHGIIFRHDIEADRVHEALGRVLKHD